MAYAYLDARATPMVTLRQYSYSTATTPASTEYSGLEELYYPYTDHFHHGGGKASPRLLPGTAPCFPATPFPPFPPMTTCCWSPLFKKWITMKYGRTITAEEYASGAKACMVPECLASDPSDSDTSPSGYNNYMSVGDQLTPLLLRRCIQPAARRCQKHDPKQSLNAPLFPKEEMEPFATETYEIVGVYRQQVPSDTDDTAMFGYLQVIIPEKSIEGGVSNIVAGGPFVPQNASFLLENGSADSFLLEFDKLVRQPSGRGSGRYGLCGGCPRRGSGMLVARILFFPVWQAFSACSSFRLPAGGPQGSGRPPQISLGSGKRRAAALSAAGRDAGSHTGSAGGALLGHAVSGDFPSRFTTLPPRALPQPGVQSDLYASENQEQVTLKTEAQPAIPWLLQWALNSLCAAADRFLCST